MLYVFFLHGSDHGSCRIKVLQKDKVESFESTESQSYATFFPVIDLFRPQAHLPFPHPGGSRVGFPGYFDGYCVQGPRRRRRAWSLTFSFTSSESWGVSGALDLEHGIIALRPVELPPGSLGDLRRLGCAASEPAGAARAPAKALAVLEVAAHGAQPADERGVGDDLLVDPAGGRRVAHAPAQVELGHSARGDGSQVALDLGQLQKFEQPASASVRKLVPSAAWACKAAGARW